MVKSRLRFILLSVLVLLCSLSIAQKKKVNVLSYYAVNNSIDGQPKIDQINVLRFYPVFAFRGLTLEVIITLYYAGNVYRREALPFMNGLYWETKLPNFELGESIQRYEVETKITLDRLTEFADSLSRIQTSYMLLQRKIQTVEKKFKPDSLNYRLDKLQNGVDELERKKTLLVDSLKYYFLSPVLAEKKYLGILKNVDAHFSLSLDSVSRSLNYKKQTDTLYNLLGKFSENYAETNKTIKYTAVDAGLTEIHNRLIDSLKVFREADSTIIVNELEELKASQYNIDEKEVDKIYQRTLDKLASRLTNNYDSVKGRYDVLRPGPFRDVLFKKNELLNLNIAPNTVPFDSIDSVLRGIYDSWSEDFTKKKSSDANVIYSYFKTLQDSIKHNNYLKFDSLKNKIEESLSNFNCVYVSRSDTIAHLIKELEGFKKLDIDLDKTLVALVAGKTAIEDTVKERLIVELTDKKFTGIGVQKSDIILDQERLAWAKILYRNYKLKNRELPALDPAEELGVFRLRYIPFPVIGNELAGPSRQGYPILFEAGLTFGNRTVVSNELFDPAFSIKKLGIAIVLSPRLFANDAEVLGMALTYDFNTYASLGVGANFGTLAGDEPDPYFSLGINQKIFQAFLKGMKNVFSQSE
ncbi:MAG: hypothetical protein ABJH72_18200 [Reichenbachiella sp.]|uniref:hypothetical protein n=1 Tax=Reichenbachiella sp. TaxID=2184521 RepID=UPI003296A403